MTCCDLGKEEEEGEVKPGEKEDERKVKERESGDGRRCRWEWEERGRKDLVTYRNGKKNMKEIEEWQNRKIKM